VLAEYVCDPRLVHHVGVTEAKEIDADDAAIMDQTGHMSLEIAISKVGLTHGDLDSCR
jgi:hypothetical protein